MDSEAGPMWNLQQLLSCFGCRSRIPGVSFVADDAMNHLFALAALSLLVGCADQPVDGVVAEEWEWLFLLLIFAGCFVAIYAGKKKKM